MTEILTKREIKYKHDQFLFAMIQKYQKDYRSCQTREELAKKLNKLQIEELDVIQENFILAQLVAKYPYPCSDTEKKEYKLIPLVYQYQKMKTKNGELFLDYIRSNNFARLMQKNTTPIFFEPIEEFVNYVSNHNNNIEVKNDN